MCVFEDVINWIFKWVEVRKPKVFSSVYVTQSSLDCVDVYIDFA